MRSVYLAQRAHGVAVHYAVVLPAAHADYFVANGKLIILRFNHLAHGAALHHLAQGLGYGVAFALVHAAAHVGVQAHVMVAYQHLAVLQCCGVGGDQFKVAGLRLGGGAVI